MRKCLLLLLPLFVVIVLWIGNLFFLFYHSNGSHEFWIGHGQLGIQESSFSEPQTLYLSYSEIDRRYNQKTSPLHRIISEHRFPLNLAEGNLWLILPIWLLFVISLYPAYSLFLKTRISLTE